MQLRVILLLSLFLVSACGGGGGDSPVPLPTPVTPTLIIDAPNSVQEGEVVTITVDSDVSGPAVFEWQQDSGPEVDFQVESNTLTFTAPAVVGERTQDTLSFVVNVTQNGLSSGNYGIGIQVQNNFTFSDFSNVYTAFGLGYQEALVQFSSATQAILNAYIKPKSTNKNVLCREYSTNDSEALIFNDSDNNNQLTAGDTLLLDVRECRTDYFDADVFGFVELTITTADAENVRYEGVVDFSRFAVNNYNEAITTEGEFNFIISQSEQGWSSHLFVENEVTFLADQTPFLTISEGYIERHISFDTARYELTSNATITDLVNDIQVSVASITPMSGFFNEYPDTGAFEMSDGIEDFVILANSDRSSRDLIIEVQDEVIEADWNQFIEGDIFKIGTNSRLVNPNPSNEFRQTITVTDFAGISEDALFAFVFNRPIRDNGDTKIEFRGRGFPFESINLNVRYEGALLLIEKEVGTILPADTVFSSLGRFDVTSVDNRAESLSFLEFQTQSEITPRITADVFAYRDNEYPSLSAEATIINGGDEITYTWVDSSNLGITFTDENSISTDIIVPANVIEDIEITLQVTNENGIVAQTSKSLKYLPELASYISFDSDAGDWVGQGETETFAEADAMSIENLTTDDGAIKVTYQDDKNGWSLTLAPPQGERLKVGTYLNATRYPFQESDVPGLDFSGNARGCNRLEGEFVIKQLNINNLDDITAFAVDFIQFCEAGENSLRGTLHYNSNLPLF